MQQYPSNTPAEIKQIAKALNVISRLRDQDITDRQNFPNIFVSGRTVTRIPSSSTDVITGDKVGDTSFATDGTFVYYLLNVTGTPLWRRIVLVSW